MNLGADIAAVLPGLRAQAESRMRSTCRVTAAGEPVWDDSNGTYTDGDPTTVYEGKCRLRKADPAPVDSTAGEAPYAVDRYVLSLPVDDSEAVRDGHEVEILTSPTNPAAVGLLLTVEEGHWQDDSTARRLPCRVVSRDA